MELEESITAKSENEKDNGTGPIWSEIWHCVVHVEAQWNRFEKQLCKSTVPSLLYICSAINAIWWWLMDWGDQCSFGLMAHPADYWKSINPLISCHFSLYRNFFFVAFARISPSSINFVVSIHSLFWPQISPKQRAKTFIQAPIGSDDEWPRFAGFAEEGAWRACSLPHPSQPFLADQHQWSADECCTFYGRIFTIRLFNIDQMPLISNQKYQ